jgi:uncharacterized protein YbjT (DUF2867 family)
MPNFAIVGASGLIGGYILQELLHHSTTFVTIIGRRGLKPSEPRLREIVVDFTDQKQLNDAFRGFDAVFISIGTTRKQVKGDLIAYRKVDHDIPISVATACASNGIPALLLVSSVGANSQSGNFYLRIKGEVEDKIAAMSIPYIGIFQPSLLLGDRKAFRLGEKISQILLPIISPLMPARYRPIAASAVAKAMIREAKLKQWGVKRYTYSSIS